MEGMTTATTSRVCECGTDFSPQYRNGLLISKHCPDCRYQAELKKRIDKKNAVKVEPVKSPVIAIKPDGIKKKNQQRISEKGLVKKLDAEFSLFIRNRDSKNGAFKCISCGQIKSFRLADCGHYNSRSHMATRWDEMNTAAQCSHCNRFKQGEIQNFRQGLIKRYGVEEVDRLELKKFSSVHFTKSELIEKIGYYRDKNKGFNKPDKANLHE